MYIGVLVTIMHANLAAVCDSKLAPDQPWLGDAADMHGMLHAQNLVVTAVDSIVVWRNAGHSCASGNTSDTDHQHQQEMKANQM